MTRLRPVIMTALAMIIGMLPMSLGLGEGGEQNAPLGRAVIGGLLLATVTTLFFVPVMYSLLRRKPPDARSIRSAGGTHDARRVSEPTAGPAADRARARPRLRSPAARADLANGARSSSLVGAAVVLGGAFVVRLPADASAERAALERGDDERRRARPCASRSSTPKVGSSDRAIALPGSVQPLEETVIYARASGYVRRWYVDIGDKVKDGQLLAEIETPELDQQLEQARAQLAQAAGRRCCRPKANRELSKANLERYQQLAPAGVASQAGPRSGAGAGAGRRGERQRRAGDDRARSRRTSAGSTQLKSFARVTAPFAGTITQRTVESGALVTAGNGQPLFKIAAMDPARVFVQVPQDVAPSVRVGRRRDGHGARVPGPHVRRARSRARPARSTRPRAR